MIRASVVVAAGLLVNLNSATAQTPDALARIRDKGMNRSQVVELFNHLTNVIGPRLTGSPAFRESVDWSVTR